MDVPFNLESRRRMSFTNFLFMDVPPAPKFRNILSFSVLTPYYKEKVLFSFDGLEEQNENGVSILFYLQKIYTDEWTNFLERTGCKNEEELRRSEELEEKLRLWALYRGLTMTRTDELQKHELIVAYYRRLYAMERGLKIPAKERTKTTNALLVSLMKQLEKNPQMDLQVMDRCHRIGQTKPVHVYRLNSVEGRVLKKAFGKLKLEHLVIGKGQFQQERNKPNTLEVQLAIGRDLKPGQLCGMIEPLLVECRVNF